MTLADHAKFSDAMKRVESLEAALAAALARIDALESKRGPGRPKDKEAA